MTQGATHKVVFTGDAKTYFSIWIKNIFLSIITLGIYSAWAKVQRRKYFAQNTIIDGRRFDYHATGKQILIGRLIIIGGFIVLAIPIINIFAFIGFIIAIPVLLNRSIAFNAQMTSFSGVRFGFKGTYGGSFRSFILYPVLSVFTLYLTYPFVARAAHRYAIGNSSYGTAKFSFESSIGPFYKAFLLSIGWAFLVLAIGFILLGGTHLLAVFAMGAQYASVAGTAALVAQIISFYAIILIAVLPAIFIYQAFLRNAVYANTTLEGGHRFRSDIAPLQLLWLTMTNALACMFTLGLMLPWAHVRMSRYLADHTYVIAAGSLDSFISQEQVKVSAIGDAYTDLEGIDLGIAI